MIGESGIVLRRRSALEQIDLAAVLLRADGGPVLLSTLPAWFFASAAALLLWQLSPWLGILAGMGVARLAQVPALLAASDRVSGRPANLAASRVLAATLTVLGNGLANLVLMGLAAVFVVPVPILWVRWVFAPEVLVLEKPESGARGRIADLVSGGIVEAVAARFWQLTIELWALLAAAGFGELLLFDVLQLGEPFGTWYLGDPTPFYLLGSLLVQPFLSIVRFCAYLELRTQREGLDAWFAVYSASVAEGAR